MIDQNTIDRLFIINARSIVAFLKEKGLSDYIIAMIITEIRSAAINAEFFRMKDLVEKNPPKHYTTAEMEKIILKN